MCSVSQRKCAEAKAVFNIYPREILKIFMDSEYVKLAGIQEYCALRHSQYFSICLILDIL